MSNRKQQMKVLERRISNLKKIHSQMNSRLELGFISQLELRDVQQNLYETDTEQHTFKTAVT